VVDFGSLTAHTKKPAVTSSLRFSELLPVLQTLRPEPLIQQVALSDPFALYERLRSRVRRSFILESAPGPERLAEFTFMGFEPTAMITCESERLSCDGQILSQGSHPIADLRALLRMLARPSLTGFKYLGGLVGYVGYDFVRHLERVPINQGEKTFPDLELGLFLDGLIFDHRARKAYYFSHREDRSALLDEVTQLDAPQDSPLLCDELRCQQTQDQFLANVSTARECIRAGEVYQIVLSRQLGASYRGDLFSVYRTLREINPSPYMYFLDFGERAIAGSSPEMLASVQGHTVTTYPIAGTRPLGRTEAERHALAQELLADAKERAEHNMLVDLARNDVGRVSKYGTVHVPDYMTVERFSHVQHIVSRVEGNLRAGLDAFDAFASLFPAGTVSGAPKIRAMELIAQLEPSARGPYAGAVGYFSLNGNMDTAITIRTIVANRTRLYLQAGAGIVYDSVPEREYAETEHKLYALKKALGGTL
jgi:anthranilate synthase component 1